MTKTFVGLFLMALIFNGSSRFLASVPTVPACVSDSQCDNLYNSEEEGVCDSGVCYACNYTLPGSPVDLGYAAYFAVLAGATITSTPGSIIIGNIGVYPGTSMTGFPSGAVSGTMDSADPASTNASASLGLAFTNAGAMNHTQTLSGADLGGLTLTPGVYYFASTAALSGILTLDANSTTNPSWVFQIGSTLTVLSGSQVIFKDGIGNPNCVFWQVGSSATILGQASMQGNVMAFASITMDADASITGRLLALNGAVTLISDSIITPPIPCHCMH